MANAGEDGEKEMRFRGVRKRKWGKYVAEIRSGKRSRIYLGSYFTPQAAESNPSPQAVRTAAIAVGSASDIVPARYFHNTNNVICEEAAPNAEKEQSAEGGESINDQGNAVVEEKIAEEEQVICESSDAHSLVQSAHRM
ncbi:hypothetical protein SUGI_0297310 [Cryptomeria japonica]|nr:hypothetical protein SUGI_0297310 [Cryptomeria japonica]